MQSEKRRADHQSANSPGANQEALQDERAGPARLAAETRRVHAGQDHYAQEAQLGAAQGRAGAAVQRLRGQYLYSGRGAQPAGAFGGPDSRGPRQGSARRALPRDPRHARFDRRTGPAQEPLEVRLEEAEVVILCRVKDRPESGTSLRIRSSTTAPSRSSS